MGRSVCRSVLSLVVLAVSVSAPRAQTVTLPHDAKKIDIVLFQRAWELEGRLGEVYRTVLIRPSQVQWYTFALPEDGVVLMQNRATAENPSTLDLFDANGKDPNPYGWMGTPPKRGFKGHVPKGQYYIRITCPKGCPAPVVTELSWRRK